MATITWMTLDQAIAFFVFAVVAAITPGPSNTMIVATGAAVGFWRGLPCVIGAGVGMGTLLFVSAMGLGQIVTSQPLLLNALNWSGAAFLLWLAWKIAKSGPSTATTAAKPVGLLEAALFQWINPKGWMVAVGAASTYLQSTAANPLVQALLFGLLFVMAALPCGLLWLGLGATIQQLLRDQGNARRFNVAMGVLLAGSVLLMWR